VHHYGTFCVRKKENVTASICDGGIKTFDTSSEGSSLLLQFNHGIKHKVFYGLKHAEFEKYTYLK
jgi:hypothetical protein